MKKLLTILILLLPFASKAQDSVKIQVSVQARDIKYIASISSKDADEDFFDGTKSKFRVALVNVPTSTTLVVVDSMYTVDWIRIYTVLRSDATALNAAVTSRVETILRAVGQSYLNTKLDNINAAPLASFVTMQAVGLIKLRRL